MRVNLLQGTYTPLTHAHAGRTPGDEADPRPSRLHRLLRLFVAVPGAAAYSGCAAEGSLSLRR
jgi:hypothetical protein